MTLAQIEDALVAALITAGFTEAERRPLIYFQAEAASTRKCVVVLRDDHPDEGTRGDFDEIVELTVALQKRVDDPQSNTELDALKESVRTLDALWGDGGALRSATLAGAVYDSGPTHPMGSLYDHQWLLEKNLFTSVTLVRYRIEA